MILQVVIQTLRPTQVVAMSISLPRLFCLTRLGHEWWLLHVSRRQGNMHKVSPNYGVAHPFAVSRSWFQLSTTSIGPGQFQTNNHACKRHGHVPVVYLAERSECPVVSRVCRCTFIYQRRPHPDCSGTRVQKLGGGVHSRADKWLKKSNKRC